jgi:hypothetical protein
MRAIIRGKAYMLQFVPKLEGDAHGMCDSPTSRAKRIRVLERLRDERRLEVIIHEILHACHWDLDEEAIDDSAKAIARILWRLGYRAEK